jgi:hypothetical protein
LEPGDGSERAFGVLCPGDTHVTIAIPSRFSWRTLIWGLSYDLHQGEKCVGHLEGTKAKILGEMYRLIGMKGFFAIKSNGHFLARAQIRASLSLSFDVHIGERDYVWQADAPFSNRFQLLQEGVEIGSLTLEGGIIRRRAMIDLPETLSLPLQSFLFWLTFDSTPVQ